MARPTFAKNSPFFLPRRPQASRKRRRGGFSSSAAATPWGGGRGIRRRRRGSVGATPTDRDVGHVDRSTASQFSRAGLCCHLITLAISLTARWGEGKSRALFPGPLYTEEA